MANSLWWQVVDDIPALGIRIRHRQCNRDGGVELSTALPRNAGANKDREPPADAGQQPVRAESKRLLQALVAPDANTEQQQQSGSDEFRHEDRRVTWVHNARS